MNYNKVKILVKNSTDKLGEFLWANEAVCRCGNYSCEAIIIHNHLIKVFDNLRLLCGEPLKISSGYRCTLHNEMVGGSPRSRHLSGEALDIIKPGNIELKEFAKLAKDAGFSFVKSYENPERIHADIR